MTIPKLSRREALAYTAAFGGAMLTSKQIADGAETTEVDTARPRKRYDMKKSINLWALPYPNKMSLAECFSLCKDAGFDAVELNYDLEGDLSPDASEAHIREVGRMARNEGLEISGLCSFLFWPYSLTHDDPAKRARGMMANYIIRKRITDPVHLKKFKVAGYKFDKSLSTESDYTFVRAEQKPKA